MIILICVIFFAVFSSLAYPYSQASAGPIVGAAPAGGLVVGTGVYVGAALLTAGAAGLIGYEEHADEINAHAARVWEGGTQAAKDSLVWSIEQAKAAGTALVPIGADMATWTEGQINNMAQSLNDIHSQSTITTADYSVSYYGGRRVIITMPTNSKYLIAGTGGAWASPNLNVNNNYIQFMDQMRTLPAGTDMTIYQKATQNVSNVSEFIGLARAWGFQAALVSNDFPTATAQNQLREAWESMRDAGLVLPVEEAIPYNADGQPLNYDPQADVYTGIDGGVYTGAPTWRLPNVRWRDKSETISVPGVYVDTPTLTGNPEFDETRTKDKPKTTTNVFTGTTTANPDIPIDTPTTPPVTSTPGIPDFGKPGTTGLNFRPFLQSGELMSKKFPFSIPFDFITQLEVLNVEPEAPLIKINVEDYLKIGGYTIPFKMNVDFSMFDPVAAIVRWGLIVVFDISLIFAIRKLMPE